MRKLLRMRHRYGLCARAWVHPASRAPHPPTHHPRPAGRTAARSARQQPGVRQLGDMGQEVGHVARCPGHGMRESRARGLCHCGMSVPVSGQDVTGSGKGGLSNGSDLLQRGRTACTPHACQPAPMRTRVRMMPHATCQRTPHAPKARHVVHTTLARAACHVSHGATTHGPRTPGTCLRAGYQRPRCYEAPRHACPIATCQQRPSHPARACGMACRELPRCSVSRPGASRSR